MVRQMATKLVAKQEALEACEKKATKNTTGSALTTERYKDARQTPTLAQAARADNAVKGARNAQRRYESDQDAIRTAIAVLQKRAEDARIVSDESVKSWLNEEERILKYEAEVLFKFDAKAMMVAPIGTGILPDAGLEAATKGPAVDPTPGKDVYAKQIRDDLQLRPEIERGQLAVLKAKPTEEDGKLLSDMLCFFEAATFSGPLPPTMYKQTGGTMRLTKALIGEVIWKAFYADRDVAEVDYIPFLMVDLMKYALQKARAQLVEDKEQMARAVERLKVVRDNAPMKNSRASPYGN